MIDEKIGDIKIYLSIKIINKGMVLSINQSITRYIKTAQQRVITHSYLYYPSIILSDQMKSQKTIQDYRNTILILKQRLHQKQNQYDALKIQYSSANVFEDTNFDWKVRQKILEVELEQLNREERKHMKEKASNIYGLHYSMLKLMKSCDFLSVTKEMVFRGADQKMQRVVDSSTFQFHLREVFRIPQSSAAHIIKHTERDGKVTIENYYQLLQYFHLLSERENKENRIVTRCIDTFIKNLVKDRIKVSGLWDQDNVDAVQFVYEITKEMKEMKMLECFAIYYQLNPLRKKELPKREIVEELTKLMEEEIEKGKEKETRREKSGNKKVMLN